MSYKKIVFGTDGSARAAQAGRVAAHLARAANARLTVVHVSEQRAGGEERLQAAVERAGAAGVRKVDGVLRSGLPADGLIAVADEKDAGIMVVSGGRGQQFAPGPVAERLSRRAPCDLLVVAERPHPAEGAVYRRILIATDGSATADRAARKGYELAAELEAEVVLVFVGHPATGTLITDDTVAVYAGEVSTEVRVEHGDPVERILASASERNCDLIVVGNKGMTGAKRFFLNAVPKGVFHQADRDVLIARTIVQAVSELGPGEGGIIERQGEKLAAFVDAAGEFHVYSSRCTHMGCTVGWNPADSVFECPCHGSRFGTEGEVVQGPAARPLPPA